MFKELNRMGIKDGGVSVAVVDSGFDLNKSRDLIGSPHFTVNQGWDNAGSTQNDENGHGTAVSGLIGGKNGVGLAPNLNLNVYRVTEAGNEGSTSTDALKMSILKACEEGNSVINVSWGGMWDENGFGEEEESHRDFYALMATKGCLVVKSAGNSARRIPRKHMNPDDALLRVEALEVSGNLAAFSSNGEISAPGHGVFTLRSSGVRPDQYNNYCGKESGSFANGTSFSSPITAAIAGQTAAVLKTHPKYDTLSGPDRVKILNRVLQASSQGGQLNALRAVLMAEMWTKQSNTQIPSLDALKTSFKTHTQSSCKSQVPECGRHGCEQKRACAQALRTQLSLCEPPQKIHFDELLRLVHSSKESDSVLGLLHTAKNIPNVKDSDVSSAIRRSWSDLHERWSQASGGLKKNMSFDQSLEMLPFLIKNRSRLQMPTDRDIALKDFLLSDAFKSRLTRDLKANSQSDLNRVVDVLAEAKDSLSREEFLSILSDAKANWLSKSNLASSWTSKDYITLTARFLDALQKDTRFNDISSSLDKLEADLVPLIVDFKIDSNPSELSYFGGILDRNPDLIGRIWKDKDRNNPSHQGFTLGRAYLIENSDKVPETERLQFVLETLSSLTPSAEEIAKRYNKSISFGEKKALEKTSALFAKEIEKLPKEHQDQHIERFWETMSSRSSLAFMVSAYPTPIYDWGKYTREGHEKMKLWAVSRMATQAQRLSDVFVESKTERYLNTSVSEDVLEVSVYYLLQEPSKERANKTMDTLLSDWESVPDTKQPDNKDGLDGASVAKLTKILLDSADSVKYYVTQSNTLRRLNALLDKRDTVAETPEKKEIEKIRKLISAALVSE